MGQKVSPTGFRLGITEEWRSRWYADKDYAKNLANDLAIRKFLDKQLARAAVSKIEIERAGDKIKIIVTTRDALRSAVRCARPSSPPVRAAPRASAFSAPAVSAVPR